MVRMGKYYTINSSRQNDKCVFFYAKFVDRMVKHFAKKIVVWQYGNVYLEQNCEIVKMINTFLQIV